MKGSLQDQLLGSGLIKKQDAKNIQTAKKKQAKQNQANNTESKNEAAELAEKARIEEQRKSQALNKQRKLEAEQKAIQAQIRQMIVMNDIKKSNDKTNEDSELTYNFTDNKKIKTLHLSAVNHGLLSRGIIAIAKLSSNSEGDEYAYHLIPAEAARKIQERDESAIVLLNAFSKKETNDSNDSEDLTDDPYAAFEIPDDLMW